MRNSFFKLNLARGSLCGLLLFLMLWLPAASVQAQFAVHVVTSSDPSAIATAQASVQNLAQSTQQTIAQLRQHHQLNILSIEVLAAATVCMLTISLSASSHISKRRFDRRRST